MSKPTPLLLTAFICLFYFGLVDNTRGPTYPKMLDAFNFTNDQGSYLYAIASFLGLIVTLTTSKWLPFIHLKKSFYISNILIAVSCFILVLSKSMSSPMLAFFSSAILGTGMGFCSISMNLAVETESKPGKQRQTFAALHTTYGIAAFSAPLLYSLYVKANISNWSVFFLFLGVLGFLSLLLFKKQEPVFIEPKTSPEDSTTTLFILLALALCVGTYVASEIVVSSRLVLFLEKFHSYTQEQSSMALSLFFFLLMLGRMSLAFRSWPISSLTLMLTSLFLTTSFCLLGLYAWPLAFALTGLSMSIFFPSLMDWLISLFPKEFPQVSSFAISGIGFHLILMHLGFGRLAAKLGLWQAMTLPLILTFFSFIMLMVLIIWSRKQYVTQERTK